MTASRSRASKTNIFNRVALEELIKALKMILPPGQVSELRALDVSAPDYRHPDVVSGYFDNAQSMATAAMEISGCKWRAQLVPPAYPHTKRRF